ncbi:MAG: deoxyribodipyrimidine photolyase, partial [Leptospiraceae bacterium]|nr:deoxyribodipyrimidine photolyase [Leptospiraceae bacterium]
MGFSIYNYNNRVRILKDIKPPENGKYILYWMQAYRRMEHNHSLDFAFHLATKENLPLVIYEGLRMDYKWNSKRIHKFILEGMIDNILFAKENHLNYWAFVESP